MLRDMPRAWIYDLTKQQLEEPASQLGLSADGALDDLRKRVKDKWTIMKPYLPPISTAKSSQMAKPVQLGVEPVGAQESSLSKVKIKLASDLIVAIPPLSSTDPEQILQFSIRATQVAELKLVTDSEFMALLISRTVGRIM
jgi:hypothetical protein